MHTNVDFVKPSVPVFRRVGFLGVPCKNDSIVADGNCFFRAISQAVSGTQKYHRKIRLAVVQQLEKKLCKIPKHFEKRVFFNIGVHQQVKNVIC